MRRRRLWVDANLLKGSTPSFKDTAGCDFLYVKAFLTVPPCAPRVRSGGHASANRKAPSCYKIFG